MESKKIQGEITSALLIYLVPTYVFTKKILNHLTFHDTLKVHGFCALMYHCT